MSSDFGNSTQQTLSGTLHFPPLRKPLRVQVLKPSHSMILRHRSEYEVDQNKKCNFQVMYEEFEKEDKKARKELKQKDKDSRNKLVRLQKSSTVTKLRKSNDPKDGFTKKKFKQNSKINADPSKRRGTFLSSKREAFSAERNDSKEEEKETFQRKWIVGETVSPLGDIYNSPG